MEEARKQFYKYCIVPKCNNTTKSAPDKVFFSVPRDAKIRNKWCQIMRRDKLSPTTCLYCCEDHFNIEEDTENYLQYKIMKQEGEKVTLRLKKGILPHIFQCQNQNAPASVQRMSAAKRQKLAVIEETLSESGVERNDVFEIYEPPQKNNCETGPSTSQIEVSDKENILHSDKAVQVNIKPQFRSKGVHVNLTVTKKNVALSPFLVSSKNIATSPLKSALILASKKKLFADHPADSISSSSHSSVFTPNLKSSSCSTESSWLQDDSDDEKRFKTVMRSGMLAAIEKEPEMLLGLPKKSYYLIKLLSENISLAPIDIMITLKKIKLNDSFSVLALHFGYAQSTISRIFAKSVPLIAEKMKELIVWPSPPEIYKNLPISFRARYADVVSIIDCLEIQIEKPSNAVHQSLTWSQYKKCNTLKYLISYTPDGLVNFISDGYSGRATDVMIVQDSSYLECLPCNKAVMADRGFKELSSLLTAKKCTLIRPPSVSKISPSTKGEVKQSKQIAALRIHVERVINRLREFHMLLPHACVDHHLISVIDEVIIVACGLINIQDVLIKK